MRAKLISKDSMVSQCPDEDQLLFATISKFVDRVIVPCPYGSTYEVVLCNGEEVIETYLEAWQIEKQYIFESGTLQII